MKIFVDMLHKKSEQQVINKQNSKIIDIFLVCIFFVKTMEKRHHFVVRLNKRPEKDFRVRFHKNCKLENYSTLSNCKTIQNQSFVVDSLFI